jgi:hypothetical protein
VSSYRLPRSGTNAGEQSIMLSLLVTNSMHSAAIDLHQYKRNSCPEFSQISSCVLHFHVGATFPSVVFAAEWAVKASIAPTAHCAVWSRTYTAIRFTRGKGTQEETPFQHIYVNGVAAILISSLSVRRLKFPCRELASKPGIKEGFSIDVRFATLASVNSPPSG